MSRRSDRLAEQAALEADWRAQQQERPEGDDTPPPARVSRMPPARLHRCTYCHQDKTGRFTRGKYATGSGWSRGFTLPVWVCWDCLPLGEGRGE